MLAIIKTAEGRVGLTAIPPAVTSPAIFWILNRLFEVRNNMDTSNSIKVTESTNKN
jgi:hypothetical protein